ncbi:MAG TPA: Zn-dependent alcohol dehydrogenase [Dehalococcoidia bacterium]|jgi:S-(hydroxymethyl)glutathione dehydrogenase/alcohol dehydrogenase|nr:Zn-dependent alcohol dehydrogenase [Dehalococcoidia bacterium]
MSSIRAALFRRVHEPLTIEQIQIDSPLSHEVLVRIVASGVCHSDAHFLDGHLSAAAYGMGPGTAGLVLGHEAAGVVEAVGDQVSYVQPGDHVVSCLSIFCGECEQCLSGSPARCQQRIGARPPDAPPRLTRDATPVVPVVNLGTFAEKMLVHEHALVKIDSEMPLTCASLLGCGVTTGLGAALNTAQVRPGSTVGVFGCGGVGLSIIQGAVLAGARRIIAVDQVAGKLDMARHFGATDAIDASVADAVAAIQELTRGRGVDYAFEAVGKPELVPQVVGSLAIGGTGTIVGVMPVEASYQFAARLLAGERKLQSCGMGSNRFRVDIPRYIELYQRGRLNLDDMVTRQLTLEEINEAFRAMQAGEVARSVLVMQPD